MTKLAIQNRKQLTTNSGWFVVVFRI